MNESLLPQRPSSVTRLSCGRFPKTGAKKKRINTRRRKGTRTGRTRRRRGRRRR